MNPYENSLSPSRHHDESFADYKERRARLQRMSEMAGRRGRILYDSGRLDSRTGKPIPAKVK